MKEKRKRPNYTKEFKQDAVKLVIEQRYSCPEVGRRLGVAASNVTRWVRQYREDQQDLSDSGVTRRDLVRWQRTFWIANSMSINRIQSGQRTLLMSGLLKAGCTWP